MGKLFRRLPCNVTECRLRQYHEYNDCLVFPSRVRLADDKLSPFQPLPPCWGLRSIVQGVMRVWCVRNKPGRAEELVVSLEEFLREGVISRKRYLSLMGRLHYTDSYILGKSGRLIMADIRSWARGHCSDELVLDDAARDSLRLFIARLRACEPRQVPCGVASHVVHVFTDGTSEGEVHSIGGVLVVQGRLHSCFGSFVPDHLISKWSSSMRHIIGPIESYAVAVARRVWHQFIASQHALFFIDNVQAQDSYIKGTSANPHVREILLSFEESENFPLHGRGSLEWRVQAMSQTSRHVLPSGFA